MYVKVKEIFLLALCFLQESVDLGEIMFSLCYLPTAGRLTLTVIKCRNLKAMDITGYSGVFVCVYLTVWGCAFCVIHLQLQWLKMNDPPLNIQFTSTSDNVNKQWRAVSTAAFCLFQQLLIFNTCNINTLSANSCRRSVFHSTFPAILISLVKCDIYCALNARVQV